MRYLVVLAMLGGCGLSTVPRDGWMHQTKLEGELAKDRYECDLVAAQVLAPAVRTELVRSCLAAKGWREQ